MGAMLNSATADYDRYKRCVHRPCTPHLSFGSVDLQLGSFGYLDTLDEPRAGRHLPSDASDCDSDDDDDSSEDTSSCTSSSDEASLAGSVEQPSRAESHPNLSSSSSCGASSRRRPAVLMASRSASYPQDLEQQGASSTSHALLTAGATRAHVGASLSRSQSAGLNQVSELMTPAETCVDVPAAKNVMPLVKSSNHTNDDPACSADAAPHGVHADCDIHQLERHDIWRLNDLEYNRCVCQAVKYARASLGRDMKLLTNCDSVPIIAVQALQLGATDSCMVNSGVYEHTIHRIAAKNNLCSSRLQVVDGDDDDAVDGLFDVLYVDIMDMGGCLRQNILSDVAMARVAS